MNCNDCCRPIEQCECGVFSRRAPIDDWSLRMAAQEPDVDITAGVDDIQSELGALPKKPKNIASVNFYRYEAAFLRVRLALAERLLNRAEAIMSKANHDNSYAASCSCIRDARAYLSHREKEQRR